MKELPAERKKRDTSQKHRLILEKAIEVFTRKGFAETSMDEIAESAGVSKRTVYNHFQSKERLFQALVADFLAARDRVKPVEYERGVPLEEQLRAFARAEMYLIADPVTRGISRLLTSVFLMNVDFGRETRGQHSPHRDLMGWLEAARADGKIAAESSELAARVFYGMVEGCVTWCALMTDGESLKDAETVLDELVATFLARYGAGSKTR